jgi:hypothetical protein
MAFPVFWGRFDLQNSHQLKPNHHKKSVSNQLVTGNHEYSTVSGETAFSYDEYTIPLTSVYYLI